MEPVLQSHAAHACSLRECLLLAFTCLPVTTVCGPVAHPVSATNALLQTPVCVRMWALQGGGLSCCGGCVNVKVVCFSAVVGVSVCIPVCLHGKQGVQLWLWSWHLTTQVQPFTRLLDARYARV